MSETSPEMELSVFQEESLLLISKQERTTKLTCKPLPAEDKGTNSEFVPGLVPLTGWAAAVKEQNAQLVPGVLTTHPTSPHCCNTSDREHINPLSATFGEEETFRFIKEQEIVLPTTAWREPEGAFVERCELVTGAFPVGRLLAIMERERAELVL